MSVVYLDDRLDRPRPEGIQRSLCGCRVPYYVTPDRVQDGVARVRESYAVDHIATCAVHPSNWPSLAREVPW